MRWIVVVVVLEQACPGSGGPGGPPVELPPSPPTLVEPTTGKSVREERVRKRELGEASGGLCTWK